MNFFAKKSNKRIVIIPALLIAVVLGSILFLLNSSFKIRDYKSTLCSLVSGPYEVMAEYDGTTVKLRSDNQKRLLNFIASAKYYAPGHTTPSGDVIRYIFKGDTDWTVDIYEVSDETLLFDVQGEKNFRVSVDNYDKFRKYVKLGTPDGWDTLNLIVSDKD